MELSLSGKVAIVTGASRGIGLAIATAFAQSGASVIITARKADELKQAASTANGLHPVVAHGASPEAAQSTVAGALERFGRLDVLVNNAATNPYMGPMIDIDLLRWDKTFEVNLRGPLVWTQAAWTGHLREHGGSIINVASVGGMHAGGDIGVYDLTKSGIIFMTKHLASELGPQVRVNAISPGLVKTDFARALWQNAPADFAWPWPLRRLGEPDDIAPAALYLASDASSWVTGTVMVVDGGGLVTREG